MQEKVFFSFLAVGFCPKNLVFAQKIMALPEPGRLQPHQPRGSYTYANMYSFCGKYSVVHVNIYTVDVFSPCMKWPIQVGISSLPPLSGSLFPPSVPFRLPFPSTSLDPYPCP